MYAAVEYAIEYTTPLGSVAIVPCGCDEGVAVDTFDRRRRYPQLARVRLLRRALIVADWETTAAGRVT